MTGKEMLGLLKQICRDIDGRSGPSPIPRWLAIPVAAPMALGLSLGLPCCTNDERDVEEGCYDTVDNDGDGETDCADEDCFEDEACLAQPTYGTGFEEEVCSDQLDNDEDGAIDCADSDCFADPLCEANTDYGAPFDDDGW